MPAYTQEIQARTPLRTEDTPNFSMQRDGVPALVWALVTAVLVATLSDNGWQSWGLAFGAWSLALLVTHTLARRGAAKARAADAQQREPELPAVDTEQLLRSLEEVVEEVCRLSGEQVEASRQQTETAIVDLSRRFSGIAARLGASIEVSSNLTQGRGGNLASVFSESHDQLSGLLEHMDRSIQSRDQMLSKVNQLSGQTINLKSMADSVQKIASQTNLLALNAAIEAARAGEMGRGFSVVADEVRALSLQSGKTGQQIGAMVGELIEVMEGALAEAEAAAKRDDEMSSEAKETVNQVLEKLQHITGELSGSSSQLREESIGIRSEMEELLVALQFQDRTSQILSHVRDSLQRFGTLVRSGRDSRESGDATAAALQPASIIAELEKGYTTQEQRAIHKGQSAAVADDNEIEFF